MIKSVSLEEFEEIRKIERKSFNKFSYSDDEIMYMIQNTKVLAYLQDDKYVGYISFFFEYLNGKRASHVESIAVLPDFRNMGIGKKLMMEYERYCKDYGAEISVLEVRTRNYNAINFYQKLGYKIINLIKGYYTIPYRRSTDAYLMMKELDQTLNL